MNHRSLVLLCLGIWTSPVIGSAAGLQPANPYPPDAAVNIPANADLTWTPGDMELIGNGGFELANFTGWVRVNEGGGGGGANNNTYINDGHRAAFLPGITNDPPVTGNYCAVTDQDGPGSITLYQDVFVPPAVRSVWLTWADQIHNFANVFSSDPPPNTQEYKVEVRGTDNIPLALCYLTAPTDPVWTGWNKRSFDLTPYRGRTVRIAFQETQWRNFFHMYYDNISVRVRDTGPVSYDVFFGTNSVPGTNEFRGTVTTGAFALPDLRPQQTYFWRVNTRFGTDVATGAVWRFTTAPVGPVDHFGWEPILSTQSPAMPFGVVVTARDAFENVVTNFSGSATVTGRTLLHADSYPLYVIPFSDPDAYATFENATVGYSFTPNTDLIVTSFLFQGKVSIWTDDGILVGTSPPIHLRAGKTYRLGMYSPGVVTNFIRFSGPDTFRHGTLNQAYEGTGDACPTQPHPARWFQVGFAYQINTLSSPILSQTAQFTAGSWNTALSIPSEGWIQLTATSASGATGNANLFLVADQMRVAVTKLGGEVTLRFNSIYNVGYTIQTSSDLSTWIPLETISGTGNTLERTFTIDTPRAFFRVFR